MLCTIRIKAGRESQLNADILRGKLQQLRGRTKKWWGRLTNNDFEMFDGQQDELHGRLQERFGRSKDAVKRIMDTYRH